MGLRLKVLPGVSVRVSRRGVRAGIGPRIARVHVGAGRTKFSTGFGPFFFISGRSKRGARTRGSRRQPVFNSTDVEEQAWRDRLARAKARGPSRSSQQTPLGARTTVGTTADARTPGPGSPPKDQELPKSPHGQPRHSAADSSVSDTDRLRAWQTRRRGAQANAPGSARSSQKTPPGSGPADWRMPGPAAPPTDQELSQAPSGEPPCSPSDIVDSDTRTLQKWQRERRSLS